jgi:hypothetical protein
MALAVIEKTIRKCHEIERVNDDLNDNDLLRSRLKREAVI